MFGICCSQWPDGPVLGLFFLRQLHGNAYYSREDLYLHPYTSLVVLWAHGFWCLALGRLVIHRLAVSCSPLWSILANLDVYNI